MLFFHLYQFVILRFLYLAYMQNNCHLIWKPLIPLALLWLNSFLLYFIEYKYKLLHIPILLLQGTCLHLPPLISVVILIIGTSR